MDLHAEWCGTALHGKQPQYSSSIEMNNAWEAFASALPVENIVRSCQTSMLQEPLYASSWLTQRASLTTRREASVSHTGKYTP